MGRIKGIKNKSKKIVTKKKSVKFGNVELYQATLKTMGRLFSAQGATLQEAVLNLNPGNTKGLGILVIQKGELKREKIINFRIMAGLFNPVSSTRKEIALKNLSLMFDL